MKTQVRITQQQRNNSYSHYYIQVLGKESEYSSSLSVIGTISFQTDGYEKEYYGLKAEVISDKPQHFLQMAKLLKYIKENTFFNVQPDELLRVIGAEIYFFYDYEFIKVTDVGKYIYKVLSETGEHKTNIIAANELIAQKLAGKYNIQLSKQITL